MINRLWAGVFMVLLLSGCGWDGTPTRNNDFIPLTSIEIVADSPAIAVSRTIAAHTSTRLKVNGNFSGRFTRDITDQVVWSSDSSAVAGFASAASPNRVTGLVPGTAILTATVGSVSSTFTLAVSSATVTTLTITPAAPIIAKGLNTQFAVSGSFSDSTTQDLTFDAGWASSAPAVATVSDDPGSKGFAQVLTVGTSTITATFDGVSGTALLTVTEPVLQSITVTPANPSILTLSTGSFQAVGHYSDETNPDITSLATWSSSQPGIATISAGGAAKTLTLGTTTISATLGSISGTTSLKATGGNLTGFTLSAANITPVNGIITLANGTVVRTFATGSFSNGSSRDITGVVAWSTANPALVKVDPAGGNLAWLNASALTGTTTVSATSGTLTATTNLTVTAPVLQSLAISPVSMNLAAGTGGRFTVIASFNGGTTTTTQDVTASSTWTSSDVTKATVDNSNNIAKGRVNGVPAATGTVNISAVYGGVSVPVPATVTITALTLQSLTISPAAAPVGSGNLVKFIATANYNGFSQDVTEDTVWTIDKPNVAILADNQNQPGQVVAVDSGSAILTATFGGKTTPVTVTVP